MSELDTSPEYEGKILAKALHRFAKRASMPPRVLMQYFGLPKSKENYGQRFSREINSVRESMWTRMAAWYAFAGAEITYPTTSSIPFPPDPHGDHPECNE